MAHSLRKLYLQSSLHWIKSWVTRKGIFARAIVEAAQNVAMYAQKSPEEVAMDIDIVATESDITVKITADTKTFDVLSVSVKV